MLSAVKGYYDGNKIVVDENDRENLSVGDEVIITILNKIGKQGVEAKAERRKQMIEADTCVIPSGRTAEEIDGYLKEMRNERL